MSRMVRVALRPLESGELDLDEASARYVSRVHRLTGGDRFIGFDPEAGTEAEVEILAVRRAASGAVRVRVGPVAPSRRALSTGVTLLWGTGKGDTPEQVLRDATALGVDRVVLVETARTVARNLGDARRRRLHAVVVDAARQSGRGNLPEVAGPVSLAEAFASLPREGLRVCLAPGAPLTLGEVLGGSSGAPLVLLVGPEGGLTDEELSLARDAGFALSALFGFVLRTETAAVAALAAALALRGRLPPAS